MRIIVVGVIQNARDQVLICKMPSKRGVFPGQWGLPGGGIEEGESAEIALRRELREEVGLEVSEIQALFFSDESYLKTFPGWPPAGNLHDLPAVFLPVSLRRSQFE